MAHDTDTDSRLRVSLQAYDQVIALSQATINMCLAYRFRLDDNPNIKNLKIENKKAGTSLIGEMKAPTVELTATKERYYGAMLSLNFKRGSFSYWDLSDRPPKLVEIPIDGWSIPFPIRFDPQQLDSVPADIRDKIELPEDYTISKIVVNFTTAHLATTTWSDSMLTGIDITPGEDSDVKGMLSGLILSYLEILKGSGNHNIVGYTLAETSKPEIGLKATLQPISSRLQTMYYRPKGNHDQETQKSGLNAFLIKEMTESPMPSEDLSWTGNWFDGSLNGTLVMSRANIWDSYLLKRLAPYNSRVLETMNEVLAWTLNPDDKQTTNYPWQLDEKPMPTKLDFTSASTGGLFKWTGKRLLREETGGMWTVEKTATTDSTIQTEATYSPGSSTITIKTAAFINYTWRYWTQSNMDTTLSFGGSTETKHNVTISVNWSTHLELVSVTDTGKLEVKLTPDTPETHINIKEAYEAGLFPSSNSNYSPKERLQATATKIVQERLSKLDLTSKIAEDISSQRHCFIFPGGGVYDMKDPKFSYNGDLLISLTVRFSNSGRGGASKL